MRLLALYRGDTFVDVGTVPQLAKRQGMSESHVRAIATPGYRAAKGSNSNVLIAYEVKEDTGDE